MQYLRSLGNTNNDAQFRRDTDHPFVLGFVDIRKCFHWSNSFSAACRVTVWCVFADGNSYSIVNPYVCYVWFSLYTPSSNDTICFVLTLGEFDILLLIQHLRKKTFARADEGQVYQYESFQI